MTYSLWTPQRATPTLTRGQMKLPASTIRWFACLAGLACVPGAALAVPETNTIEFSNCALSTPGSYATAPARCGFLEVPENPAAPDGRRIRLHVAVAPATSPRVEPDPVFFFAGGPGQAASETWLMIQGPLRKVRKHRDIVMIDQRGTGQSNKLDCPPDESIDLLNAEIDFELMEREVRRCLENLDGDPRMYTTSIAMQDYDRVREAMDYERINLVGVSYGTRAAQVYLRQYPDRVRSVVLDSVVPMQLALGQEHAPMLDRAVQQVLAQCAAEETCNSLFPDHAQELNELFRRLRETPRQAIIINPWTGQPQEIRLSAETLAVAIRFLSYASETQALLPLLVHEAVTTGNLERLASQALLVLSSLDDAIARGMEASVLCSEDYPVMDFRVDQDDTIMGGLMLEAIRRQCAIWPRGEVPDGFHDPVASDVPVLLMSGERDPVTPPSYAALVARTFANNINLVAHGQSHSVLRNVCLQEVMTNFIEQGSVAALDTACVESIRPAPFFTSLLGPDP